MAFNFSPMRVFKGLSLIAAALAMANLIVVFVRYVPGHDEFSVLINLFDFNHETNIPTLYSSFNLMFSAVLLGCIARQHKANRASWLPWVGLSLLLGFLSIDETASIHERFAYHVQQLLNISNQFYFVWVLPYIVMIGFLLLLYFKFFMRLPAKTRTLFLLSGALVILGAVGFEIMGNLLALSQGTDDTLAYRLLFTCEELLEMFGVITLIYALFDYIVTQFGLLSIQVAPFSATLPMANRQQATSAKTVRSRSRSLS